MGKPMDHLELGGQTLELVRVEPGTFVMGSPNEFFSEAPPHLVTLGRAFRLGKFPVTQRQWRGLMGDNPSRFPASGDHPVENVSWLDAARFCERLSERCGRRVRLPSEAEWEYACRAGTKTEYFFADGGPFADETSVPPGLRRLLGEYAWFHENSAGTTRPVGQKRPNPWGLHDLVGNVWEWCADHWHDGYDGAPADGAPWPGARRPLRVLRGGAWDMNAFRCRSTYRSWDAEDLATDRFGLRVCVET